MRNMLHSTGTRWHLKIQILQSRKPQWLVAQEVGWSESRLSRLIHGRVPLDDDALDRLQHVLGVPRSQLVAAEDDV